MPLLTSPISSCTRHCHTVAVTRLKQLHLRVMLEEAWRQQNLLRILIVLLNQTKARRKNKKQIAKANQPQNKAKGKQRQLTLLR
eukprot:200379-Hanusia_phi.AAC.1